MREFITLIMLFMLLAFIACGGEESGLPTDGDVDALESDAGESDAVELDAIESDAGESDAMESDTTESGEEDVSEYEDVEYEAPVCDLPTWKIEADPEALEAQCRSMKEAECARAFDDCPDLWLYVNEYGDLEYCQSEAPQDWCSNSKWDVSYIDTEEAQKCLDAIPGADCDEFEQEGGLEECWWYEKLVPPDPALCTFTGPGKYTRKYDVAASRYLGDYVILLCVCLDEGQQLEAEIMYDFSDTAANIYMYDTDGRQLPLSLSRKATLTADKNGAYVVMFSQTSGGGADSELMFNIDVE